MKNYKMEERESGFSSEVIEAKEGSGSDRINTNTLRSRVETSPLNHAGANFKTHVLIEESSFKIVYKPSLWMAVFASLFLCAGLAVLFFSFFPFIELPNDKSDKTFFFTLLFGGVFTLAGGFMFYYFYKPRGFDKQSVVFYKSYKTKIHGFDINNSTNHIRLENIVAIQLLGEHVQSNDSSYKSFELNLVLKDGTRKNVVDHGNLSSIVKDARVLSQFLSVPIWHVGSN